MEFQYQEDCIFATNEKGRRIAEISFPIVAPNVVDINHTFVDFSLRGQGVADQLVCAAIEKIKQKDCKARVSCSYAKYWFEKHPAEQEVLTKE